MTKLDIVNQISKETGIEKYIVVKVVENLMDEIQSSMIKGEEVFLRGFGSFILKTKAEKKARNISKNTTIVIPSHTAPAFKPAKEFNELLKK